MGQVAKPLVSEGPMRAFYERLHALHEAAGRPSMRQIQRGTRDARRPTGINPTTIHDAFSSPRLARWEVVEAIVRQLHGDVAEFAPLWKAALDAFLLERTDGAPRSAPPTEQPPRRESVSAAPAAPPPRQLPSDVFAFTGRSGCMAAMDGLLKPSSDQPTALVISALAGTAGVGKTALAVHWSHRVTDRFPDGQLYVDLRGYGPDAPLTPEHALAAFLRTLGVRSEDLPYELADRAARYRSLMADRKMLVVLDNVNSADQVRPLLPGSPTCLVLITSRDSLAGLVARDGARRIDVDLLDMDEAESLLRTLIGARADAEPAAVESLARLCTRLPLALRIAAELAISRPATPLADLVAELDDEQRRLDLLDAGADERTALSSVFSWSYQRLPEYAARAFRLLGLNPGPDIDIRACAALVDLPVAGARRALDALARANLLETALAGRYTIHDLLRVYAARLAQRDGSAEDRQAALDRLFDYYLTTAAQAMDVAFPVERHRRPHIGPASVRTPVVETPEGARAWLDNERSALVSTASHAAYHGRPNYAIEIAAVLWRYLQNGAHHSEAVAVHTAALHASTHVNDRSAGGTAQINLGTVYWRLGRYDRAANSYERALAAFREIDDPGGQARALVNLGAIYWQWGRYEEAVTSFRQAVTAYRCAGDHIGEARALDGLGTAYHRQGCYDQAVECHQEAVDILNAAADRAGAARALDNLGVVYQEQGRYDEAATCHRDALDVLRDIGDRAGEAQALQNLGDIDRSRGRYEQAFNHYELVLDIARTTGNRGREASALNAVAETFHAIGRLRQARDHHLSALARAEDTGNRYEHARALSGIAAAHHATGAIDAARRYWTQALTIYTEINAPEADDLARRLAGIGQAQREDDGGAARRPVRQPAQAG